MNDNILDPFSGSGTTLRVAQQLKRNCIGIEINEMYVEQTKLRLQKEFSGFDSIDPRMERIPNDLNNDILREEYLKNHIKWFLKNHENTITKFYSILHDKYSHKLNNSMTQKSLFD